MNRTTLVSILAVLAMPWVIAGCNGGEDFADADLGTDVIEPSPRGGSPLGADVENIKIEFVDDRVAGLGYECIGDETGTGYIGRRLPEGSSDYETTDKDTGDPLPLVAECGVDATRVNFFLGSFQTSNRDRDRFRVGTLYLPQQIQQEQLQVTPADIVTGPARIAADTSDTPNRHALYLAALLQALDADPDNGEILVPVAAHEAITSAQAPDTPSNPWDYAQYQGTDSFVDAWQSWFDWVDQEHPDADPALNGFPANVDEIRNGTDGDSGPNNGLNQSLDRLRAGTFKLVSSFFTHEFVATGEGSSFSTPMVLDLPILVYPDGKVRGVGYAADITNTSTDSDVNADNMVAISDMDAFMDRQMRFDGPDDHWPIHNVFDSSSNPVDPDVALDLTGRILGISLYYAVDGPEVQSSDYEVDYPQSGVYTPTAADGGRYKGTAFGQTFDYENNNDGAGELLQGSRNGIVGVNPDAALYGSSDSTTPSFYQLQPWQACSSEDIGSSSCQSIANNHPAETKDCSDGTVDGCWHNYARHLDGDTSDDQPGFEVSEEQPKPATDGQGSQEFTVEIRDDGYIVTDLDRDCSTTSYDQSSGQYTDSNGSDREYRVGFVTRTKGDASTGSVNIILHMAGPRNLRDVLPHYGLRVGGRIDLDGTAPSGEDWPLYRTGDANFSNGIRARWLDQAGGAGYAFSLYERANGGSDSLSESQKEERISRIQGALEGHEATTGNGGCL